MLSTYMFSPSSLTIPVGDSVRVTNRDSTHHTFTDAPVFDSGDLGQNGTYTFRFATKGRYAFACSYHSAVGMKGTITVTA